MFNIITKGPHGDTIYCKNPNKEAIKQQFYISAVLHRGYSTIQHADGHITVNGDGLAALTFAKED